ncbi:sigma factor-like helix-turn-helix DNA-binding protein [Lentilactobacillus rapi]|uniref:sigma factor-like helix-turn-helix DNA-binding protein n=1 Tax=Lentilactobacillus rapi TaxID=481723 RepID=UPI000AF42765|nr:sigma factor-like helix-turn-helix DNA-binding protein [Lentilactobacillus rapi]
MIPKADRPLVQTTSEQNDQLAKVLHKLAAKDRQLLKAKYLDNQSIDQLATQAGKSPAAIKMRLYRIRRKIRKVLGDSSNG